MWADDDCVSCLQTDQCLEDSCRCRVRCRNDSSYQANRLSDLLNTICRILFQNTTCLQVTIFIISILCCVMVLDYLIFYDSHSCLFGCHLCQRNTCLISCHSRFEKDLINLFLSVCCKDLLGLFHLGHLLLQPFRCINFRCFDFFFLCHNFLLNMYFCLALISDCIVPYYFVNFKYFFAKFTDIFVSHRLIFSLLVK